MNAQAKRDIIEKIYGNLRIKGALLSEMDERQIHAIYGRLLQSGTVQEYENLKIKYAQRFDSFRVGMLRAGKMSIFDLREAVNKVNEKDKEGYQYTLFDWQQYLEGKEQEKEWRQEQNTNVEAM